MPTTLHMSENHRKRPSLSEQINRLDKTLDGLADGLNEAVADAVKEAVGHAVRQAVQAVLTEVLANPEILAKLNPVAKASEPQPPTPSRLRERLQRLWAGVRGCLASVRSACSAGVQTVRTKLKNGWTRTKECLKPLWSHCTLLRHFKYHILLALSIGIATAVGVWYAKPWLGAVLSGIGGFVTTVAVQVGLWLRHTFTASTELEV